MAAAFAAVVSSVQAETIAEIAAGNPDFSLLVAALQTYAPELLDAASSSDAELTVFAPNNDAFAKLTASLDVGLTELDPMLVKSILEAHVINKVVLSTDLSDGLTVESIGGYPLTFTLQSAGGGAFVNDVWIYPKNAFVCGTNPFEPVCVEILNTDIIADNGVIHVINGTPVIAQTEMTPQLATDPWTCRTRPVHTRRRHLADRGGARPGPGACQLKRKLRERLPCARREGRRGWRRMRCMPFIFVRNMRL